MTVRVLRSENPVIVQITRAPEPTRVLRHVPDDANPSRMIHRVYDHDPYTALCGAKLQGVLRPNEPVECHVCEEIEHRLQAMGL